MPIDVFDGIQLHPFQFASSLCGRYLDILQVYEVYMCNHLAHSTLSVQFFVQVIQVLTSTYN